MTGKDEEGFLSLRDACVVAAQMTDEHRDTLYEVEDFVEQIGRVAYALYVASQTGARAMCDGEYGKLSHLLAEVGSAVREVNGNHGLGGTVRLLDRAVRAHDKHE